MPDSPSQKPRIGLTLDAEPGRRRQPGLPWYAIRANYCAAIGRAGGLPLALPHEIGARGSTTSTCSTGWS